MKALGARPVAVASGGDLTGVDGSAQLHLAAFLGNRYARTIPYVATDALWPRPLVVIAGPQAWERLSEADRDALVEAGRLAAGPVLDWVRDSERSAIPQLCRQGARFFQADVADLRRAVEPVYAAIRRDATAARVLEAIDGMRSPDAGEPIACPADDKTAAAGLPTGTYTWTITRAEALRVPGIEQEPGFLAGAPGRLPGGHRTGSHRHLREQPGRRGGDRLRGGHLGVRGSRRVRRGQRQRASSRRAGRSRAMTFASAMSSG